MDVDLVLKALIAIAPVLILLFVFDRLDTFNLISLREIAVLLAGGGAIAGLGFAANWLFIDGFPIGFTAYTRYVSPPIEESMKAAPIIALFMYNRIGFKLDAAIAGFAVGAGFSVVENIWYLFAMADANVSAWLVRGFGTAVMHSGATALFAVISHEMTERQAESAAAQYRFNPLLFAPGLGAAIAVHAVFNHFPDQPLVIMAMTLLLVPATLFLTFARSERVTQIWLKTDEAAHRKALEDIRTGRFAESEAAAFIRQVANRLKGATAADAMAYVELKTELVLRAEQLILASQSGTAVEVGESERQKCEQLDVLERRLGQSVIAAIDSRVHFSRNDLWELGRLRARARDRRAAPPGGQPLQAPPDQS